MNNYYYIIIRTYILSAFLDTLKASEKNKNRIRTRKKASPSSTTVIIAPPPRGSSSSETYGSVLQHQPQDTSNRVGSSSYYSANNSITPGADEEEDQEEQEEEEDVHEEDKEEEDASSSGGSEDDDFVDDPSIVAIKKKITFISSKTNVVAAPAYRNDGHNRISTSNHDYYQNNLPYTSDEENHRVAKHSINFKNSLGNSSTTNTTRTKISKNKR